MTSPSRNSPGSQWLTSALLAGAIASAGFAAILGAVGALRLIFEVWQDGLREAKITCAIAIFLAAISAAQFLAYRRRNLGD